MEKLKKYQRAIKSPFMPDVQNKIISDTKNHHYQLVRIGWFEDRHVHYSVFHFEILDGKVWILENRTDVNIEAELLDAGIAAKDIKSGLGSPIEQDFALQAA
jgi:hypothetical protein